MSLIHFLDEGDRIILNTAAVTYIEAVKDGKGDGCNVFFSGVDNPRRFSIAFEDLLEMLDLDAPE